LTTFRVGGPAEWLADVRSIEELEAIVADASRADVPVTVLGGGSNVLVADAGVPGVVLRPHLDAIAQSAPGVVRAESGVTINGLVRWTIGRGLAGLEAWAGTPGTVGGAIYGNAHWGGRNIGDLVSQVRLIGRDGRATTVAVGEMAFAYDTSRLKQTGEIVAWADLRVTPLSQDDAAAGARERWLHLSESGRERFGAGRHPAIGGSARRSRRAQGALARRRADLRSPRQLHRQRRAGDGARDPRPDRDRPRRSSRSIRRRAP
jgi:UDP-N-acetylmuramate dehydrogenase